MQNSSTDKMVKFLSSQEGVSIRLQHNDKHWWFKVWRVLCIPISMILFSPLYAAYARKCVLASIRCLCFLLGEKRHNQAMRWCTENFYNLKSSIEQFNELDLPSGVEKLHVENNVIGVEQFVFVHKSNGVLNKNNSYCIFCSGNGGNPEFHFKHLANYAAKNASSINMTFSHPGFGKSSGWVACKYDLVDSMVDQAKFLLSKNIRADQIVFGGMSLGGATATLAYHQLKQCTSREDWGSGPQLMVDRTFVSSSNVAAEVLTSLLNYCVLLRLPVLRYIIVVVKFVIQYFVAKPLMLIFNWDMQVEQLYRAVPYEKRMVTSIKSKKMYGRLATGWTATVSRWFKLKDAPGDMTIARGAQLGSKESHPNEYQVLKEKIKYLCEVVNAENYSYDSVASCIQVFKVINTDQYIDNLYINKPIAQALRRIEVEHKRNNDDTPDKLKALCLALLSGLKQVRGKAIKRKDAHHIKPELLEMRSSSQLEGRRFQNIKFMDLPEHFFGDHELHSSHA